MVRDAGALPGDLAHVGDRDGFSPPAIAGGLPPLLPDLVPIPPALMHSCDDAPTDAHPDVFDDRQGERCPIVAHMRRTPPSGRTTAGRAGSSASSSA